VAPLERVRSAVRTAGLNHFLSPRRINARIASERVTSFRAAHRSMVLRRPTGIRSVIIGSRPVVRRPLFLVIPLMTFAIFR
jgi:hypothetical protein